MQSHIWFRRVTLVGLSAALICTAGALTTAPSEVRAPQPAAAQPTGLPFAFVPADGGAHPLAYQALSAQGSLRFTAEGVRLTLPSAGNATPPVRKGRPQAAPGGSAPIKEAAPAPPATVRLAWIGADSGVQLRAGAPQPGRVNVLHGQDRAAWRTGLPTYGLLTYENLYPGISLAYTGDDHTLKGTYTLAVGADPAAIRWRYSGAAGPAVDAAGNLQIGGDGAAVHLTEARPVAWQEQGATRQPVDVNYQVAADGSVGFRVGAYDPTRPLIIDPALIYSTYIGGSNYDEAWAITTDASGNAYISGMAYSDDFPTTTGRQYYGYSDALVAKFAPDGSLIYATLVGGDSYDGCYGIGVDSQGRAHIGGYTDSTDFPLFNPFQTSTTGSYDVFVSILTADGNGLAFSTYLGGSAADEAWAVTVDQQGATYLAGFTQSNNYPRVNAYQTTLGGTEDAFVTKIVEASGVFTYGYSTLLGGGAEDQAWALRVDGTGAATVAGLTKSGNFPTLNAYSTTYHPGDWDSFVTKLAPAGNTLGYSTYLGGTAYDGIYGLALTSSGAAVVTGETDSTDYPLAPATPYQNALGGGTDAFITALSAAGNTLAYSTYFGGSEDDAGWGIGVDGSDQPIITGQTDSPNLPLAAANQTIGGDSSVDAFVSRLNAAGTSLTYSTYLGADDYDVGTALTVDSLGKIALAGITYSTDFPVAGANITQDYNSGFGNSFVTRIDPAAATPATPGTGGIEVNADEQSAPQSDGVLAVWEDNRNGNWDIRGKDLRTGQEFWVVQVPADQRRPMISGDLVVWQDNAFGNWNVWAARRVMTTTFSGPTPVATGPGDQMKPAVEHNLIIWQQSTQAVASGTPEDSVRWDIAGRTLNILLGPTFLLTAPNTTNLNPALGLLKSGDARASLVYTTTAAWQSRPWTGADGPVSSGWQINGAIRVDSTPTAFAVPATGGDQLNPSLSGQTLIWQQPPPTALAGQRPISSGWQINGALLNPLGLAAQGKSPGALTAFTVTTGLAAEPAPDVSNDQVVWQESTGGSTWSIRQVPLQYTATPVTVAGGIIGAPHPAASGAHVVWQDVDPASGSDVYGNVCGDNGTPCPTTTPCTISFTDVPVGSTFYNNIQCLICQGIVGGYNDATHCPGGTPCFQPSADVTRGQMAKFIANAAGYSDTIPATQQTFSDVPPTSTFWLYVERAALHGVIGGYADGTFRPGNPVTRAQTAKFVANAAGYNDTIPGTQQTFTDVPPGDTFWIYIERVALHGVVGGYSDGTFRPSNGVTRGQTTKFIGNAFFPTCAVAP